ncbi:phospholipase A2 inhibitor and Ly6/PLAUR domain-containing protein-like [Bufo gargarizans]|uniref:phospholipase A2 inhibitor and Ly6/PLAUR domain-containing protein-like n=1 Tax=Bufo gargarizans TaxID=30331 RepID=UPI001CF181F3|nr:phospholipase A2 inhibitor and Ly6/PLAUR domain-containing protein-like [Bufo gargarizans]XP_044134619.1 phospholipase A2 inhibitor and Ly6/PLAUR domain-containing protein-like [Bufo gargarizans]
MASPWVFMCILSALAKTGFSLECIKCIALGDSSCTEGPIVTCPQGHTCTSMYQETIKDGKTSEFLYRSCGPTSHCNKTGSFTIENQSARLGISCCYTDNCYPPLPQLQSASTRRNGKVCQMCSDGSEACSGTATIDCVGNENKCILQVTKTIAGTDKNVESYRGCGTKSICEIGNQNISFGFLNMESTFPCGGGAVTMYRGLDFSMISAIVLLILLK